MVRHSFSTSFVPRIGNDREFVFYVTFTRWEDEKCIVSETIYQKNLVMVPDLDTNVNPLLWAAEMADRAWQEIVAAQAASLAERQVNQSNTTPER